MQVDVIEATGLVLVEFRRPRGTYRVGDTGGVPPADIAAGVGEGVFVLAPVPDGIATTRQDLGVRPPTGSSVVPPAVSARAAGGVIPEKPDVEIPADWQKLHHLRRFQLARAITGELPHTAAEADATITAYLAK
ncbi:hypothetical protein [Azorhizobium doebereinerae]|uniref:hypothetical protein n=1 Tax=Azorhizobium doebereinerae TaxID=281091 RepID=UPI00048F7A69|nr:hypothetical protein [Azorhizobium doebereinerae]